MTSSAVNLLRPAVTTSFGMLPGLVSVACIVPGSPLLSFHISTVGVPIPTNALTPVIRNPSAAPVVNDCATVVGTLAVAGRTATNPKVFALWPVLLTRLYGPTVFVRSLSRDSSKAPSSVKVTSTLIL